jgi:hypothetical protein
MFEVWNRTRELRRTQRAFAKDYRKLVKRKAPSEDFQQLDANEYFEVRQAEKALDWAVGNRLHREARSLDVEVPPTNDMEMWFHDEENPRIWFTPKGRAHVRKLIDEEKGRRFEVKTRWVTKFILPFLTALIGIIGALTGLVAVLQHKK